MRNERSFLGATREQRRESINGNLNVLRRVKKQPINELLEDKTIIVVEDSVVRGNVGEKLKSLLFDDLKVKKAYLAVYTPPIGITGADGIPRGCTFGVDMPPNDNFIARNRSIEEISEKIGMPVHYLSVSGMYSAFERAGISREKICSYCIGGKHPLKE